METKEVESVVLDGVAWTTAAEAAAIMGKSPDWVYKLARAGKLPARKFFSLTLVDLEAARGMGEESDGGE